MLSHYRRFIPNLSTVLEPLYNFLKNGVRWKWLQNESRALETEMDVLKLSKVPIDFDPNKPIILQCDASNLGLSAVLGHAILQGSNQPVAFATRTILPAEKIYA